MSRRDLLRRGAAAGTAMTLAGGGAVSLDEGPVQESQAIAPVVAAGVVGGSVAVGWALREFEVVGSDAPADGLTESVAVNQARNTVNTRYSTNQSTFVDNRNIIDGINDTAYADAKIAAIDALNEEKTEEEVLDAGTAAVDEYATTVQENLIKSWNESVQELETTYQVLEDHEDASTEDVFTTENWGYTLKFPEPETIDLPDGSTIDEYVIEYNDTNSDSSYKSDGTHGIVTKINDSGPESSPQLEVPVVDSDGNADIAYLKYEDWNGIYSDLEDALDEVRDGLSTWVSGVYGDVQAGELETDDLLTPREQAELTADEEDFPQALADLEALNVSVDYEREATIHIPDRDATLIGRLSYSGDTTFEVGTVDPDATDDEGEPIYPGTIYFTYDVSEGSGGWSDYETGIDGGILTFTAEPYEETLYTVKTTGEESVDVVADDFTHDDGDDVWTVDLSEDLENPITEVDSINIYSESGDTQYETIQLEDTFEIKKFEDSEGEEHEESNFERSEPQTDDNYISKEEWQEQQERHEELIEKYEESQENDVAIPGVDEVLAGEANGFIGIAVVGFVLLSAVLSALNPFS